MIQLFSTGFRNYSPDNPTGSFVCPAVSGKEQRAQSCLKHFWEKLQGRDRRMI